LMEIEA